jgi:hypothetical protein
LVHALLVTRRSIDRRCKTNAADAIFVEHVDGFGSGGGNMVRCDLSGGWMLERFT